MTSKGPVIKLAQEVVDSYSFDRASGVSTFTIPAGVTDIEALRALNAFFREKFPAFNRDVVEAGDAEWQLSVSYEEPPKKFPDDFRKRDYSKLREVTIMVLVPGTEGKIRESQREVLAQQGLVFADPRDIALAVALHACTHKGADLCADLSVRGTWHNMVQGTGRSGLSPDTIYDDHEWDNHYVAASGMPASQDELAAGSKLSRYTAEVPFKKEASAPGAQPHASWRFETIDGHQAIVAELSLCGQQLVTLLSEGSFNKKRSEQISYAEKLGYRLATRKEHLVYIQTLLAKEAAGSINQAESNALVTYRRRFVRDADGGIEVGAFSVFSHICSGDLVAGNPRDGALFVRAPA